MFRRLWRFAAPVVAIVLFALGSAARADTLEISSALPVAGVFSYRATLTSPVGGDSQLVAGDFFVIFDFAGYVAGSHTETANWSFVGAQNVGSLLGVPPGGYVPPVDDISSPNLAWKYTGPTLTVLNGASSGLIGTFTATSTLLGYDIGNYSSQDRERAVTGFGTYRVSGHNGPALVPVPLPPALWGGLGLMGLMSVQGIRRQRANKVSE